MRPPPPQNASGGSWENRSLCATPDRSGRVRLAQAFDRDLDQRAVANHRLHVGAAPHAGDLRQHPAAFGLVGDDTCAGRQVSLDAALEVEREVRIGLQVAQPAALAPPCHARDVDPAVEAVKDDLDASWLAAAVASGGHVDDTT